MKHSEHCFSAHSPERTRPSRGLLAIFKVRVYCVLGPVYCSRGQMVKAPLSGHTTPPRPHEKVCGSTEGWRTLLPSRPGLSRSWDCWPTDWVWKPFQSHKAPSFSISISEVAAAVGNASANKRPSSEALSYWCLQKQKKWSSGQDCCDGQMLTYFFGGGRPMSSSPPPPRQPHLICSEDCSWAPYPGIVPSQGKATPPPLFC